MRPGTSLRHRLAVGMVCVGVVFAGFARPGRPETTVEDAMAAALARGRETYDHGVFDALLGAAVRDGGVDYGLLESRRAELDRYLEGLARVDLAGLAGSELEALLINAYNALTIRSILDHPGIESIRDIDGVWDATTHVVGGYELTLDDIEHRLLRPYFRDPRIHFAVNCASASCAPLASFAYRGSEIDAELEARTRAFMEDPRQVRVESGKLLLSRYFDWYGGDFTNPEWSPRAPTVAAFVARYASPEVEALVTRDHGDPPLEFLDYDWALNALPPPADP